MYSLPLLLVLATASPEQAADKPDPSGERDDSATTVELGSVVRGKKSRRPGEIGLTEEEARKVPGGMGDAVSAVQSLPGVGTSIPGGAGLVLWGATPRETAALVDGVPVPSLFHLNGFRSVVETRRVQRLELTPGVFGAEYGRAMGGLIEITTARPESNGFHGSVGADLLDATALVSGALTANLSASASARYSYLNHLANAVGSTAPIPSYGDWQLKALARLRADETLEVSYLGSTDTLLESAAQAAETHRLSFHRLALIYRRAFADGTSVSVTPYVGWDKQRDTTESRGIETFIATRALLAGVRAEYRIPVSRGFELAVGTDTLATSSSLAHVGSLNFPHREGDLYVFGQPPHDELTADEWQTFIANASLYVSAEAMLGPVQVRPGVRVEGFNLEVSRVTPRVGLTPAVGASEVTWVVDPRLQVTWAPTSAFTLTAAGGVYHQAPDPTDLSAVFGSPLLDVQRAIAVSAGASLRWTRGLTAEVTGYARWLDGLAARSPRPNPPLVGALTTDGAGFSRGVQTSLRARFGEHLTGWLSYVFSASTREGGPDQPTRLLDYDQPQVLSLVLSSSWGPWSFGMRAQYASGFPRTPVLGGFFNARTNVYEPIFGEQNTDRLPPFFRMDLHVERRSRVLRGLRVWLDLQNVTNRSNPQERVYDYDFRNRAHLTGLPFLAVLGLGLDW
ncbi:MAG: TonB-dependent receptor [Myxococcaceae bacterium]